MRSGTHIAAGFALAWLLTVSCSDRQAQQPPAPAARPSILLVTLDTTRADADRPWREGHRDAGVQRARRARPAFPAGVRDRPGNAALAHLDADRALSRRPRRARERALPRRAITPLLAESLRTRRLSNGGVRLVVRAVAPLRPGARVRALRRRAAGRRQRARRGGRRPSARSPTWRSRTPPRRCSSGSTTSIPTRLTSPPARFRTRYATALPRRSRRRSTSSSAA